MRATIDVGIPIVRKLEDVTTLGTRDMRTTAKPPPESCDSERIDQVQFERGEIRADLETTLCWLSHAMKEIDILIQHFRSHILTMRFRFLTRLLEDVAPLGR